MQLVPLVLLLLAAAYSQGRAFNGEQAALECPDDCECYYFRVNWVLDCSNNNMSSIPYDELSKSAYVLDLNDNRIEDVEPFAADLRIRRLQLAHNLLTEVRGEAFAGLRYLIDADFSGNRIRRVDPVAFHDSAGLIALELQGNPLDPVEGPFLSIKSLLYLDISDCNIEHLNSHFFENIAALSTLDLSGNPLRLIENGIFDSLASLETLKMTNCNLTFIATVAFSGLSNLKHLELSGNSLHKTDWSAILGPLIRLEYLDLRKAGLVELPVTAFANNTYLRTLILAENELPKLDAAATMGHLQHLETLDLSLCHLQVPLSEDVFVNATKISTLHLSGNSLFASDLLAALAPLSHLQKLSLSSCGLGQLPDTFHRFRSLRELDISHNPLTSDAFVKLIAPIDTLEYLNMGYSNLSYIAPTSFAKMTSMRRLILSGNDLFNLEAGLFGNLTRLESLELNFCGLRRSLNATLFFNNFTYTDLKELQLAGNPLQVSKTGPLLPRQLSRLEMLDLSNCNLTFLPSDAFQRTRNITTLILAGNNFSSPNDFSFLELLPRLEVLDLRYNNLSTISPKDVSLNPRLTKLMLVGNPWRCTCSIAQLWDWASVERGDVSVLDGSTIVAEHVTVGKTGKRKTLLVCNYDPGKPLPVVSNETVAATGRRPFSKPPRLLTSANRTWAKYVRESGCQAAEKLRRSPRAATAYGRPAAGGALGEAGLGGGSWLWAAVNACVAYITLMSLVGAVFCISRTQRAGAGTANPAGGAGRN